MGPPEVNWKWKGAIVGPMSRCSRCATSHVRHPWIPCSVMANLLLQLIALAIKGRDLCGSRVQHASPSSNELDY
ncbi:hypothetical protein B0T12DRAFT_409596 [Alternaria alternata]|nr:hypothetical protein B0T12DRAFT_409596 [Alternaria alternata]